MFDTLYIHAAEEVLTDETLKKYLQPNLKSTCMGVWSERRNSSYSLDIYTKVTFDMEVKVPLPIQVMLHICMQWWILFSKMSEMIGRNATSVFDMYKCVEYDLHY